MKNAKDMTNFINNSRTNRSAFHFPVKISAKGLNFKPGDGILWTSTSTAVVPPVHLSLYLCSDALKGRSLLSTLKLLIV